MSYANQWQRLMAEALTHRAPFVTAQTVRRQWDSASSPWLMKCDDGEYYVVKGRHNGRVIVNDQLVGRLGMAMGAPVGEVVVVNVPETLIDVEPALPRGMVGTAHGSRYLRGCSDDREASAAIDLDTNRARFALLAVLYGWVGANDHQVIYRNQPPRLVYSVDHGHFFPGGPDWTETDLWSASSARPDPIIMNQCHLGNQDIVLACRSLEQVSDVDIASVTAAVPDDWQFASSERFAVAEYLLRRRQELLAQYAGHS